MEWILETKLASIKKQKLQIRKQKLKNLGKEKNFLNGWHQKILQICIQPQNPLRDLKKSTTMSLKVFLQMRMRFNTVSI